MLDRQSSSHNFYRNHSNHPGCRSAIPRHSCLQRQKSKKSLLRQHTSICLPLHKRASNINESFGPNAVDRYLQEHDNNDNNNNNNNSDVTRRDVSDRVKHYLLKLSKGDFIKSFVHLDYTYSADSIVPGESDELVGDYINDNIAFEPDITANTIDKDDFQLGQILGMGGFGRVYMGNFRSDTVAIKVMHKFTKNPDAQLMSFKAELHVMRFKHPNVVKTLAATHIDQFDDGAWIVMEYVGHNSLQRVINNTEEETIPATRRMKYALQIASALQYAHHRKVAHLDLKPANILITDEDDCKVGDFGCSQRVEFDTGIISPTNRATLTGTFAYRAPELLRGEPPTFKADIYSYGITLWQLHSREQPYCNQNQHVVIFGVCANGLRPRDLTPAETDPFELSYKSLYCQCWEPRPLYRPSAQELVELLSVWTDNL